jgi:hypothetical protein
MTRRSWRSVAMAAMILVAAGCGGAASPQPAVTAGPPTLAPGTYVSSVFRPPVTYTVPEGWLVIDDTADYFAIQPASSDVLGVHLFRSPLPASQDADCSYASAAEVGTTAADIVGWIVARPGLVVSDPAPTSLGGLGGLGIDLGIAESWTSSCPFANDLPTVPLFVSGAAGGYRWVIAGGERLRLAVLDVPGSGTIVVDIDDFDGRFIDEFLPVASPIVAGLRFGLD